MIGYSLLTEWHSEAGTVEHLCPGVSGKGVHVFNEGGHVRIRHASNDARQSPGLRSPRTTDSRFRSALTRSLPASAYASDVKDHKTHVQDTKVA